MRLEFIPGDIIMNKKPYDGESPKLIVSFDRYGYLCYTKPYRSPNSKWDFKNLESLTFDNQNLYHVIDHVKVNLNVTVEE